MPELVQPLPRPRGLLLAWAVSLLIVSVSGVQLARSYGDRRSGGDQFQAFSSDFLAAAAFYEDVFVDHYPVSGFQFSAATFAVPDVLVYLPVRAIAGSPRAAQMPWQACVFLVLVLSGWYAVRGFAPPRAVPWIGPLVFLVIAAFMASVAAQLLATESRDLLLPGCHTGAQSLAFLSVGLLARYLRDGRIWRLFAMALLGMAACFSDRLFALYFPVPAFLAVGLARVFAPGAGPRLTYQRIFLAAGAVALGCVGGLMLLKKLPTPGVESDPLNGYWAGVEADGFLRRGEQLYLGAKLQFERGDALIVSSAIWLVFTAGLLAVMTVRRIIGVGSKRVPLSVGDYAVYSWITFPIVTVVFLVSATGASCLQPKCSPWGFFDRYFAGPQCLALFGWALLLAVAAARGGLARVIAIALPAVLAVYLLTLTFLDPRHDDRPLLDPYPKYVQAMDEICKRRGLTNGFSGYWQAKESTYYSHAGVRVRAVTYQKDNPFHFGPSVWLSNAEWLFPREDDGPYQFFIANAQLPEESGEIRAASIREVFGPAVEEVQVDNIVIMVYDRPSDDKFRNLLARNPELGRLEYRLNPRRKIRFSGASFYPGNTGTDQGSARVAGPGDPAGCLAHGPYLVPRLSGWHYAEFRLTATGDSGPPGSVDVYLYDNDAKKEMFLTQTAGVPAGYDQTMRLEFFVPPELVGRTAATLQFRTSYHGHGSLRLEYVDFGRFRK